MNVLSRLYGNTCLLMELLQAVCPELLCLYDLFKVISSKAKTWASRRCKIIYLLYQEGQKEVCRLV